jgi:hypothetical protein
MRKTITVYLSGPMYLGKEQATGWRDEIINYINFWSCLFPGRPNFRVLNPCDRWLEKGGELEAEGAFVVQMDKMEMAKADVFIVNATNPGWGTPIEQYIGWSTGKMIICFSDCDFPSIWAWAHCHKMCRTHIEAAEWLCEVAAKQLARVV